MAELLPQNDISSKDLAVPIAVGRFLSERDADYGEITYRPVRFGNGGVLCDLKYRDENAPAFLTTTKPNRPVIGLNQVPPYLTLDVEVECERDFKIKSLSELRALIPQEEKSRATFFEPRYLVGAHGEKIARINLYQRR